MEHLRYGRVNTYPFKAQTSYIPLFSRRIKKKFTSVPLEYDASNADTQAEEIVDYTYVIAPVCVMSQAALGCLCREVLV